ncbi:MAG: hypothetical protein M0P52_01610 [Rhodoferax sp.]|nr:hypothetical protein [Rhodoferax sp.]
MQLSNDRSGRVPAAAEKHDPEPLPCHDLLKVVNEVLAAKNPEIASHLNAKNHLFHLNDKTDQTDQTDGNTFFNLLHSLTRKQIWMHRSRGQMAIVEWMSGKWMTV